MSYRMKSPLVSILGAACLATAAACSKAPGTEERKTETTTQTSSGRGQDDVRVDADGEHARGEDGDEDGHGQRDDQRDRRDGRRDGHVLRAREEDRGLTADKTKRDFALDAKDTTVSIDSAVAVGSRVKLTEHTGDDHAKHLTVKLEG